MKLITEINQKVEYLQETTSSGEKAMYIVGPFMQYDIVNRNGRRYPKHIMEKEVNRYTQELINENRAYGELNHPKGPQIDLERVCILIKELKMIPGSDVMGKARIVETPKGQIVKGLIESGANLGVSSRGLGSLKEAENNVMDVQEDFHLVTASDVVADPSAPSAFVKGIMEGAEWLYNDATGEYVEAIKKDFQKRSVKEIEELQIEEFKKFLRKL